MKISSIICTADILQTLSKITDSNLLQWTNHLNMTIAVDWDVKIQPKQNKLNSNL